MRLKFLVLSFGLSIAVTSPVSEALADEDNLFLSCMITTMTLCVGDTKLEGCPNPWLPVHESTSAESTFSVSRVSGIWVLAKQFTAELRLINSDDQHFEFSFTADGDWARLRIDRLSGELIELHGLPGQEILAAKGMCEKVERKF